MSASIHFLTFAALMYFPVPSRFWARPQLLTRV